LPVAFAPLAVAVAPLFAVSAALSAVLLSSCPEAVVVGAAATRSHVGGMSRRVVATIQLFTRTRTANLLVKSVHLS
jgi:hypothetical protein